MKKMILFGMLIAASFSQISAINSKTNMPKINMPKEEELQSLVEQYNTAKSFLHKLLVFSQKRVKREDYFDVFKKSKFRP